MYTITDVLQHETALEVFLRNVIQSFFAGDASNSEGKICLDVKRFVYSVQFFN